MFDIYQKDIDRTLYFWRQNLNVMIEQLRRLERDIEKIKEILKIEDKPKN